MPTRPVEKNVTPRLGQEDSGELRSEITRGGIPSVRDMSIEEITHSVLKHREYIESTLPGYHVNSMLAAIGATTQLQNYMEEEANETAASAIDFLRDTSHQLLMSLVIAAERDKKYKQRIRYQKDLIRKLKIEMAVDPMSGLFNQATFRKMAPAIFHHYRETNQPFAYVMGDLDCFHDLNEEFGHDAGDFVIEEFGNLVRQHLRVSDFMFRYRDEGYGGDKSPDGASVNGTIGARDGGEEFSFILPGTSAEEAAMVAERFRKAVEEHRFIFFDRDKGQHVELPVTISTGVSFANYRFDTSFDTVKTRADKANQRLKREGRNGAMFCDLGEETIDFELISPEDRNKREKSSRDKDPAETPVA